MFPQTREQQRSIILDPIISLDLHTLPQPIHTLLCEVKRKQVLLREPFPVAASYLRVGDGSLGLDPEKEVDGGLFIGVCGMKMFSYTEGTRGKNEPRRELV
jgi:hypothetical protein